MKKYIILCLLFMIAVLFGACQNSSEQNTQTEQVIRIVSEYEQEDAAFRQLERFRKLTEEATDNKIQVKLYAKGEWDEGDGLTDYLQADMVEMACVSTHTLSQSIEEYKLYQYPCLFADSLAVCDYGLYNGEDALAYCKGDNQFALGFMANGQYYMVQDKMHLQTVADFNGLILDDIENDTVKKAMTLAGVRFKAHDSFEGTNYLLTEGGLRDILSKIKAETCYISDVPFFYDLGICIVNQTWWDHLDQDTQNLLEENFRHAFERECSYQNQTMDAWILPSENYVLAPLSQEVKGSLWQMFWPYSVEYITKSNNPLAGAFYQTQAPEEQQ